jgi:hypothetical protein
MTTSRSRWRRLRPFLIVLLVIAGLYWFWTEALLPALLDSRPHGMSDQGTQMYKAIRYKMLDDPDAGGTPFPTSADGFTSSTEYFTSLVTSRVLPVDFSFFTGPGLPRYKTMDPTQFKPDGNAWSVVLDVGDKPDNTPFMICRNFLPGRTSIVTRADTFDPSMLGEKDARHKLEFDERRIYVVTKGGKGFFINAKDLTDLSRFNPTDHALPLLRP